MNKECSSHIDCTRYIVLKNFINLNIFSFLKVNGPLSEAVLASISNYETLIMDVLENAVFFQPKKEIKNFYFDPNFQFQDYTPEAKIPLIDYNLPRHKRKMKEIKEKQTNKTKDEIPKDIDDFMKDNLLGETYEYKGEDFELLIYPTNSDLLLNKTHIDFLECEHTLKSYYNLSNESIITVCQLEISNKNERSLINQVEYIVVDAGGNYLDLSVCNDTNIKIIYSIKENRGLKINILNSFKDTGINVFNISEPIFNDVCFPYSENGNDLILEDRFEKIYQNFTICEEGCSFDSIDIDTMLITCRCNIKENMTSVIKEIEGEATEKITSHNFEIIKCYNLILSFNGKMKNYGFWILSGIFFIYIIFLIIYCCNGVKPLKVYIFNEMAKFGYINKRNSKIFPPKKKLKTKTKDNASFNDFIRRKKTMNRKNPYSSNSIIQIEDEQTNNNKKIKDLIFNLITINVNDLLNTDIKPKESNITLLNYTMEEAFKYDRRNYCVIFYIYLLSKQAFFHAFLYRSPLALFPVRFCLLLFIISNDLAFNAFYYLKDNISRKYRNTQNIFIFTITNNYIAILLTTLAGFIILTLLTCLSNTTKVIRDIFKNEEKRMRLYINYKVTLQRKLEIRKAIESILRKYKCKIFFLFFFEIILMICYWYYVVVFCHVFSETQMSWLIDSGLSIISRFIIDIILCLIFAKLYKIAVASNYSGIYTIALFFYGFC